MIKIRIDDRDLRIQEGGLLTEVRGLESYRSGLYKQNMG